MWLLAAKSAQNRAPVADEEQAFMVFAAQVARVFHALEAGRVVRALRLAQLRLKARHKACKRRVDLVRLLKHGVVDDAGQHLVLESRQALLEDSDEALGIPERAEDCECRNVKGVGLEESAVGKAVQAACKSVIPPQRGVAAPRGSRTVWQGSEEFARSARNESRRWMKPPFAYTSSH